MIMTSKDSSCRHRTRGQPERSAKYNSDFCLPAIKEDTEAVREYSAEVQIKNKMGLHWTPIGMLKKIVDKYSVNDHSLRAYFSKEGKPLAEITSLMDMATLELPARSSAKIIVRGNGAAEDCLRDLVTLVNSGFGEEIDPAYQKPSA